MEELSCFRLTIGRIGDFHGPSIVVSRTGYSGELGYEVFCHPKDAEQVFDSIWEAGAPHGMTPLGLGALDMIRIEAGLIFAGSEFGDTTDPMEAGIGFTVPLKSTTRIVPSNVNAFRASANNAGPTCTSFPVNLVTEKGSFKLSENRSANSLARSSINPASIPCNK